MTDTVNSEIQSRAEVVTARHSLLAVGIAERLNGMTFPDQVEEIAVALATEFRFGVNYAKAFWFGDGAAGKA